MIHHPKKLLGGVKP